MAWRELFLRNFGPGLLCGVTFGDWMRLLRHNSFAIAPSCWPRALAITSQSLQNSALRWMEDRRYGPHWRDVEVGPPLFVLGHWRSGTTHLHNLLVVDDRFAFPNNYQALYPHTFFVAEAACTPFAQWILPKHRPMDNLEWTMQSPQEDEFALCTASCRSPCLGWVFANQKDHYDRFLTFRRASAKDIAAWKAAFVVFLKKLTWKHRKPLILKSPPHTCRIKLLLELFPQAKFVHIHRHPYAVFQSSRKTFRINYEFHRLQRPRMNELDDDLLKQYAEMYEAFFEERKLIPRGHYHEISFEQLERDPIGEMRTLYRSLDLPAFERVQPALEKYVASIAGYQKNAFPDLPPDVRNRIATAWRPSFTEWGYEA